MRVINKDELLLHRPRLIKKVQDGAVFIYPTDTIYGIGCLATDQKGVQRIRELKRREKKPFSIIAPSLDWIMAHCVISAAAKKWLLKLPGPYTLVLPLKDPKSIAPATNAGLNSVGVRIPDHWIASFVESVGVPIVTTSVNVSGEPPASTLLELQRFEVDFILFEGTVLGKPSTVVELTGGEKVVR